jgi:Serine phosphatase RsbU, regulator of sigma subunit
VGQGNHCLWHAEICYIPLDILSGDSYSIREVSDGKVMFFISDAMGKGLSASVTSILSTSFINHLIDEAIVSGGFDFKQFLVSYINFIKKNSSPRRLYVPRLRMSTFTAM